MGISPSRESVGFGIEIELSGVPLNVDDDSPEDGWDYKRAGFQALKDAMGERYIPTTMDPINPNGRFMKHPGDYNFWHLTQDNSIDPKDKPAASEFSRNILTVRYRV